MSFSVGIVGLPNVGKSTLFKALTQNQVNISNYPFCTIDPNVGVVKVPEERLNKLEKVLKPEKILPTVIEFVDIAGLVKGAHQGEGLGNQFLSHIRGVDAILQVVRTFEDKNVIHVAGKIDPKSDIEVVNLELIFADLSVVEKRLQALKKELKSGSQKEIVQTATILEKIKRVLDKGELASSVELTEEEKDLIKDLSLLTLKPVMYVLNVDENNLQPTTYNLQPNSIPICAKLEAELGELSKEEAEEYIKELELKVASLDELIKLSYKLLDLVTFFTIQSKILQAWTVPNGAKAPEAAGKIHTDFKEGFIKAEVINWQDLVKVGSEGEAREKGLVRTEGKDYLVQDGDVIHFRFSGR
ncbi:MAG: redox-regulated ATPase YchF [Parcubacteria group bacterium CG23_combo_of_CG06-09_8_20_14_all_35_9]|nr:MAG: redox-regulated ATPase YchF [Parcubacteria group bacterium CG23_combo_of_CG06-09_8_20_14_all_35_9]